MSPYLGIVASAANSGAAGGGGPVGPEDFFAADGKTWPWYGHSCYPAAFHHSGVTWFCWESYSSSEALRIVNVTTYNHSTGKWTPNVAVASHTLTDDDHGVPAMVRDADGYVHIFYGAHDSATLTEAVTVAPDDPSAWRVANIFSGGSYTYPHPVLVGSVIYLFIRKNNAAGTRKTLELRSGTPSAGVTAWSAESAIIDWGADSRVYQGNTVVVGTDIHFAAVKADFGDDERRNVYYFVYETATGDVHNAEDDATIASADRPVDLTESDADFKVTDTGTDDTMVPSICLDSNGDMHLLYIEGTGTSYDVQHKTASSVPGAFGAPATVASLTNTTRYTGVAVVPGASGTVEAWYTDDAGNAFARGGDMIRAVWNGSWGSPATILAAGTYGLDEPFAVLNAHADCRVCFCEVAGASDDADGGDLTLYAYGDSGFLIRAKQAPDTITLSSTKVYEGASIGDVVGVLRFTDADPGDTVTWSITSDPDSKFDLDGNELVLTDTVSAPDTHDVTVRATDSHGLTKSQAFTITAVETVDEVNDTYAAQVELLIDASPMTAGTDASIANVELLIDAAGVNG